MKNGSQSRFFLFGIGVSLLCLGCWLLHLSSPKSQAAPPWLFGGTHTGWGFEGREDLTGPNAMSGTWFNFPDGTPALRRHGRRCGAHGGDLDSDVGGYWLWMRSPEQERVVVSGLFNRYCIRCHGIDGRGVWDIPGVPDFTNSRWQASRSDDQIARIIIEGRGAVMPAFRGTLNLEEAFAMARYLRTFDPSQQMSRPDFGKTEKNGSGKKDLPKGK
jgi:Cytochrome C oxidase, cbb3-type, subunit III